MILSRIHREKIVKWAAVIREAFPEEKAWVKCGNIAKRI